jgi:single-strand DNA-binding protein|tara:strand:- start:40 stop:423 length:384 start_codon:yes stop_codon:yes gene_type:complete
MGFNYNHVTLVGRLTKDPKLKEISDSFSKLSFQLAVSRSRQKSKHTDDTDFIPVSILGYAAPIGNQLLSKGTPVLIWGRIEVRRYEKDGDVRWMTEVIANNFQILETLSDGKKEVMAELEESVATVK